MPHDKKGRLIEVGDHVAFKEYVQTSAQASEATAKGAGALALIGVLLATLMAAACGDTVTSPPTTPPNVTVNVTVNQTQGSPSASPSPGTTPCPILDACTVEFRSTSGNLIEEAVVNRAFVTDLTPRDAMGAPILGSCWGDPSWSQGQENFTDGSAVGYNRPTLVTAVGTYTARGVLSGKSCSRSIPVRAAPSLLELFRDGLTAAGPFIVPQ